MKHARYFIFSFVFLFLISLGLPASAQTTTSTKKTTQQASTVPTVPEKESTKKKSNKSPISSEIGLNIPEWGLSIDAAFNPELDDLIPGYHILNIVLTNRRPEGIELSASDDRWIITDREGHRHTASNHVTQFDKKLWEQLPPKLQKLLDYPPSVNAGKSVKIDVFFSKSISLYNFKELAWRSGFFDRIFNIFTTYEDKINTPNEKEFEVQKNTTPFEPESDLNNSSEDLPKDEESDDTPSKFDQQNQTNSPSVFEQPQEQTIVIH